MSIFGDLVGGAADIYGGNKASGVERRATRKAGKFLDEGYQGGIDLAKPGFDTATGDYQRQSDRYNAGEFYSPDQQKYQAGGFDPGNYTADKYTAPGAFNFNAQDVFSDPEYQAQMRSGTQAIEGGASSKGTLFSGKTAQDLQAKGQDIFAGRSDELYNRNRNAYENDRNFGRSTFQDDRNFGRNSFESDRGFGRDAYQDDRNFDYDAGNRAYDTNAANRALDFTQGQTLADFAPGATENMIDLGMGRAQSKADTELGVGNIRSRAIRGAFSKAGKLGQNLIGQGEDAALKYASGGLY